MALPVLVDTATRLTDATFYGKVQITGGSGTVTSISPGSSLITLTPNPITNTGTVDLSVPVPITAGGTNAITAAAARNNLLPSQAGQTGKQLQTDGANVSWQPAGGGSVTSISAGSAAITLTPNPITLTGTVDLTAPVTVPYGGTGVITLAAGYVKSSGTSPFTSQAVPIPVTDGGTGAITFTAGYVKGSGTSTLTGQAVPIPAADGGTGTTTALTQGSVVFAGAAGAYSQDNANAFWDATNHRLGLGTATPNTTLDVAGAVSNRKLDIAVSNGLNSNIALTNASWVRLTGPSAGFSIGGFTNPYDGRILYVYNTVSQTMTVVNEDASSTAANRITTTTGANVVLASTKPSVVAFRYDATASRWIMVNAWNYATAGTGDLKSDGSVSLTNNWTAGNYNINSRNSMQVFNMLAYGAVPNGVYDNTSVLNAIISAMDATGGIVIVPAGTCNFASTISTSTPLWFIGSNPGNSQLQFQGGADGIVFTHTNGSDVVFQNVNIVGTGSMTSGALIHCASSVNFPIHLKNVYFSNYYTALQLESNWFSEIDGCRFNGVRTAAGGSGIYVNNLVNADQGGVHINGCTWTGIETYCVRQGAGGGTTIVNSGFVPGAGGTSCVYLDLVNGKSTGDLTISSCNFEGNQVGPCINIIPSGTWTNVLITANEFAPTGGLPSAIQVAPPAGGSASYVTITGNTLWACPIGVDMSGSGSAGGVNSVNIGENIFYTPTTAAIKLPASAGNVTNLTIGNNQYVPGGASQYISGSFSASSGFNNIYYGTGAATAGGVPWTAPITVNNNIYPPRSGGNDVLLHLIGADGVVTRVLYDTFGSSGQIQFRTAAGTNQTPTAVVSGSNLFSLVGKGYGATGYSASARVFINAISTETWSDTAQGVRWVFGVTPTGTVATINATIIEADGTLNSQSTRGLAGTYPMTIFRQKATSATTANTYTTLFGSGNGTLTLPASWLLIGSMVKFKIFGYISTADGGAGTKGLKVLLGGTTLFTATSGATFTTVLNAPWVCSGEITCYSTGAPGTVHANAKWETQIAAAPADSVIGSTTTAVNVTTTGTLALDVQLNNGNATGVSTTLGGYVEVIP